VVADHGRDLFDKVRLPPVLDEYLRGANPWWESRPGRVLPAYRRWAFHVLLRKLATGLAPVVLLRGARQVGKTTLLEQAIQHLLAVERVDPRRILRVQFDEIPTLKRLPEPVQSIAAWFQNRILGATFNEAAHAGRPAYLFFDEAQNLPDWAPQVKALVDHHTVHVVVTGSSALRIEAGRDSLAGRVAPLDLGTLLLREVAGLRLGENIEPLLPPNGLDDLARVDFWRQLDAHGEVHRQARDQAFRAFSERGGYPIAQARAEVPWPEVADQLNETVIRRVIQHDLRVGDRGRKRDSQLLEEVFRLCCRYAGQAPSQATLINEIKQVLRANTGWQRILSYMRFLEGSLLVRLVRPLELRLKKVRGPAKLCIVDHGLRQSWLEEIVPLDPDRLEQYPDLADLAGHIAESVVGAYLGSIAHLDVAHFPERPTEPEVDFVLTIGERRIPVEVKYRRHIDPHRHTLGLRSFVEQAHYHAPFGILVTMLENVQVPDPRIVPLSLRSLLLAR
jgi:predicted AAA+ superfamily ATPase